MRGTFRVPNQHAHNNILATPYGGQKTGILAMRGDIRLFAQICMSSYPRPALECLMT